MKNLPRFFCLKENKHDFFIVLHVLGDLIFLLISKPNVFDIIGTPLYLFSDMVASIVKYRNFKSLSLKIVRLA